MFQLESSARNGFAAVECPIGDACSLLCCIFKHDQSPAQRAWMNMPVEAPVPKTSQTKMATVDQATSIFLERRKVQSQPFVGSLSQLSKETATNRSRDQPLKAPELNDAAADKPAAQEISPPPLKRARIDSGPNQADTRKVQLYPEELAHNPAPFPRRLTYIQHFHREFQRLNQLACESDDANAILIRLLSDQLIELANGAEATIARGPANIYENKIRHRLVALKKMKLAEWIGERLDARAQDKIIAPSLAAQVKPSRPLDIELSSSQEVNVLRRLISAQNGLDRFGYVTTPPSERDVQDAREYWESHHYESCERCGGRFQVFHNRRDEDGALTSNGPCKHHWGRIVRGAYACCNETVGSSLGCSTWPTHVFKSKSAPEMSVALAFASTPHNDSASADKPVCFDCEMAFTTNGLELIRLTAIAWPSKETLIDVLVRPAGHVLDLNTRFSGVTLDMLERARPHADCRTPLQDEPKENSMQTDEQHSLTIVESPAAARQLLFDRLTPSTPLIGHAIENDLNAVRVVHPCIVDTVILFPHDAGPLPNRMSLKALTKKFLWRDIQMESSNGHDSLEDAVATADLVRLAVSREWRRMKNRQGWKLEGGQLVEPEKYTAADQSASSRVSRPTDQSSATKRKHDEDDQGLNYGGVA